MEKKGLFSAGSLEDTWRAELTWFVEPAQMRRGTQGHMAEPREPTRRAGGAQGAHRGCGRVAGAMRVHVDAQGGAMR